MVFGIREPGISNNFYVTSRKYDLKQYIMIYYFMISLSLLDKDHQWEVVGSIGTVLTSPDEDDEDEKQEQQQLMKVGEKDDEKSEVCLKIHSQTQTYQQGIKTVQAIDYLLSVKTNQISG